MMKFINKKNKKNIANGVGVDAHIDPKNKIKIFVGIILGVLLSGGIGAYAEYKYLATEIKYTDDKSVAQALNELYQNKKETSDTVKSITSNGNQTLDKYYKNLNVNVPVPSTYKNLTTATTVQSNKLLNGITAYDNNGNLITGNLSDGCVSFTYTKPANSQVNIDFGFKPSKFYVFFYNPYDKANTIICYNTIIGSEIYAAKIEAGTTTLTTTITLNNNILTSTYNTSRATYQSRIDYYVVACP